MNVMKIGSTAVLCLCLASAALWGGEGERVRPAAVAGSWYPADAQQLATYLDGLLDGDAAADAGQVRALISPHAGYLFSGAAAADGLRQVRGMAFERVIVLGPSHRGWFRGLSVADVTHYETPLGRIPLDQAAVAALHRSSLVSADPDAHRREHSIEMQLPLLQRALAPGWKLLPLLVGNLEPDDYRAAADLLRPLVDRHTLVVVSSDFTHYGPRYDYLPFAYDGETAARIESLDRGALAFILARDAQGLLDYQQRTGATICGLRPIALLLHLLGDDAVGSLQTYATSGQLTADYRNSVSYLSILFRGNGAQAESRSNSDGEELSRAHMLLLHDVASAAVEAAARPRDPAPMQRLNQLFERIPPVLETPSGAFVTLKKGGQLRGCIGYIRPHKPLYEAVAANGINAARNDHRFPPLREEELEGLEVEVSVLTPPRSIASYEDFRVGEEGIILEKDGRSAVFLPEVAEEQGWDRDQTLTQLARKAGLPEDGWKSGASFQTFQSRKFSAPYSPGSGRSGP
jgi:AmmeMemoRadiSam system protein B/AmmeMemoRadiSam system protein A